MQPAMDTQSSKPIILPKMQKPILEQTEEDQKMKTRVIHTKFWSDGYVLGLTRAEKLLFIYLITNDCIGLSGIYELPDSKIIFETGLTQPELDQTKDKFSKDGKFTFYKGWVKIINVDKYQQFKGEKNEIAKENEINLINTDVLDTLSIPYAYPISGVSPTDDSPNNHKSVISNQKPVREGGLGETIEEEELLSIANDYEVPLPFVKSKYDDLVNYCKRTGKRYKDYKAALRNFVKQDAMKVRKEAHGKSKLTIITPDPNWVSDTGEMAGAVSH